MARTNNGGQTDPYDTVACSFCLYGAVYRSAWEQAGRPNYDSVAGHNKIKYAAERVFRVLRQLSDRHPVSWNDALGRRHIDVLCALDLAILAVEDGVK
jgi:hypothetical protein